MTRLACRRETRAYPDRSGRLTTLGLAGGTAAAGPRHDPCRNDRREETDDLGDAENGIRRTNSFSCTDQQVATIHSSAPAPSASGKTLVVASTRGNQKTAVQIDGKDLYLGANAYVYAEPKAMK